MTFRLLPKGQLLCLDVSKSSSTIFRQPGLNLIVNATREWNAVLDSRVQKAHCPVLGEDLVILVQPEYEMLANGYDLRRDLEHLWMRFDELEDIAIASMQWSLGHGTDLVELES